MLVLTRSVHLYPVYLLQQSSGHEAEKLGRGKSLGLASQEWPHGPMELGKPFTSKVKWIKCQHFSSALTHNDTYLVKPSFHWRAPSPDFQILPEVCGRRVSSKTKPSRFESQACLLNNPFCLLQRQTWNPGKHNFLAKHDKNHIRLRKNPTDHHHPH